MGTTRVRGVGPTVPNHGSELLGTDDLTARSYHPGGVNVLKGDGSVKFVKDSIDGMVWRALGRVAGGEVISADAY